jgi:hypothetical protein
MIRVSMPRERNASPVSWKAHRLGQVERAGHHGGTGMRRRGLLDDARHQVDEDKRSTPEVQLVP